MQATRQRILDHLRVEGETTVRQLGEVLGLTATGVRQHLTILEQEDLVSSREERGKVGRPALAYSLTHKGEESYPTQYDALANALLDEARSTYGAAGYQRLIRGVALRIAKPHVARLADATEEERVRSACEFLQEQDVVADWERKGDSFLLHQRTCPYPEVARHNAATCLIDVALVSELTAMDARLVSCLVRGDRSCTYRMQSAATA